MSAADPVRVFLLYAKKDKDKGFVEEMETHLALLKRNHEIVVETEDTAAFGSDRHQSLIEGLDRAEVILFLVSANLVRDQSDLVQHALDRARVSQGRIAAVPVLVRPFDEWRNTAFGGLRPLPSGDKPVSEWRDEDAAWVDVVRGLRQVLGQIRNARELAPMPPPLSGPPVPGPVASAQAPGATQGAPAGMAQAHHPPARQPGPAPVAEEQIKILFLSANPSQSTRLAVGTELREIRDRLWKSPAQSRFTLIAEPEVRVSELASLLLRHRPHILHFSGHGQKDGALLMEDPARPGANRPVPPAALSRMLAVLRDNLRCVVLNACYTATAPQQAQAVAEVAGFCIGMSNEVDDESSIHFAAGLYEALAFGRTLDESFQLASAQIALLDLPGDHLPTLLSGTGQDARTVRLVPPHA